MTRTDKDLMTYIVRDTRYRNLSAHDLKIIRKNMIESGNYSKYEFALVQYWIMQKENRKYISPVGIPIG